MCLQGIDLVAGGKSKKTKRTAPKSDDVYLKLTVKVRTLTVIFVSLFFFFRLKEVLICFENIAALQVSGKENTEQVQCSDSEEAFHEQSQQSSSLSLQARRVHDWQGSNFV